MLMCKYSTDSCVRKILVEIKSEAAPTASKQNKVKQKLIEVKQKDLMKAIKLRLLSSARSLACLIVELDVNWTLAGDLLSAYTESFSLSSTPFLFFLSFFITFLLARLVKSINWNRNNGSRCDVHLRTSCTSVCFIIVSCKVVNEKQEWILLHLLHLMVIASHIEWENNNRICGSFAVNDT